MMHNCLKWLACCLLILGGGTLPAIAQDGYDPTSPSEPQVISYCRLTVSADPAEGAYVSGGGKYRVTGGTVYVSTSAKNTEDYTYTFKYWTLDGQQYTTSQNFYYQPTEGTHQLVAHYDKKDVVYDPDSPAEPSTATIHKKYMLYLKPNIDGACSFSIASGEKHAEGSQVYLRATYQSDYYTFNGWKVNGQYISYSNGFYYTMPSAETTVEAVFTEVVYDPEDPIEPSGDQSDVQVTDPNRKIVKLYIGNTSNSQVDYTDVIINEKKSLGYELGTDMAKTLSSTALYQIYSMDNAKTVTYSKNERPASTGIVPLGIVVNSAGTVVITGTRLDCTATLVDKTLNVTQDLSTGPYVFTSEAGTFDNRFELKVPTGTILLGDANNSGEVNVADITAVVSHIYGQTPTNFNTDAADVNKSGEINVADITGIVSIIYGGSSNEAKSIVTSAAPVTTLSMPAVSVNSAGSVCVPFSFTNSGNLSSCQFDLVLPDGIKAEYVETMSYAHQCVGRYISDNTYRIMCYSMSNANFMASAPVGYLTLSVDGAADGTYNLGITSAVVSSKGEEIIPAVQNGKLTVGNPTGINEISASDSEQMLTVISLNGMRFKLDKSRLNSLQKGIYIINGKKQIIKN